MKTKLLFTSIIFLFFQTIKVSAQNYYFSTSSVSYSDLTGATNVIPPGTLWDNDSYEILIGFNFEYFGKVRQELTIETNGTLYFGRDANGNFYEDTVDIIFPFGHISIGADLIDRGWFNSISVSPISYKVDGSPGSRVLKIEWKNAGFSRELLFNNTLNDYVNFQVWLYEGSNKIESRIGPNSVLYASYIGQGPAIGLDRYDHNNFQYLSAFRYRLDGNPIAPSVVNYLTTLNGTPPNGKIYIFSTTPTSIAENTDFGFEIYPNPATTKIHIHTTRKAMGQTAIYNLMGEKVIEEFIDNSFGKINISYLKSGIYFLSISDKSYKIIKQ